MNNKKRGKYLVSLRNRKGFTQQELSHLLHYSDKNISKWETGKSFPSDPNILNELANIFEVPVENIIYGEDNALDKINELALKRANSKIIKVYFLIIFILTVFMFGIIFKYNNYYVAKIGNKFINETEIFIILTDDYNRFKFKKLESLNKKIELVSFYYEKDNQTFLLFETENEDIVITEYSYYLEYNFSTIVDNSCYLKILYSDKTEDIIEFKFNKYITNVFN